MGAGSWGFAVVVCLFGCFYIVVVHSHFLSNLAVSKKPVQHIRFKTKGVRETNKSTQRFSLFALLGSYIEEKETENKKRRTSNEEKRNTHRILCTVSVFVSSVALPFTFKLLKECKVHTHTFISRP